jgi:Flp pilus assembly protein TadG
MTGAPEAGERIGISAWRDERGASAVEFALVMPVFLLILVGTLCYGLYFGAAHSVQQLAAEAARATVPGLTPVERALLAQGSVNQALPNYAMIDGAKVAVTVGVHAGNPDLFDVAVTYDASGMPIWMFEGLLPLPPKVIQRAAVVRRGGY